MTETPTNDEAEPDTEADKQADAMKDQLRKDVASWAAARAGDAPGLSTAQAPKPAAATRAPRQRTKAVVPVAPPVPAVKQPFKMSYDGTTDRDYIAQRIKLGAR